MTHDLDIDTRDLDWAAARQPQRITSEPFVAGDPFARERARQALARHIDSSPGRGLSLRRRLGPRTLGLVAATGAAALVAVALLTTGGPADQAAPTAHRAAPVAVGAAHQAPLMRLADYVSEAPAPAGDATVVQRTTTVEGKSTTAYDLFGDGGAYYFAESKEGLTAAVEAGEEVGGGMTARQLAAAEQADSGDVEAAARSMASSANTKRAVPAGEYANRVWIESMDAIDAGAGKPRIRAGVMRILATLPDVTVAEGVEDGVATLVLTSGPAESGSAYTEQLTIDAETGVPIKFVGGPTGGAPDTTVEYQISRANYPGLAAPIP
jgi:hypothetical protein